MLQAVPFRYRLDSRQRPVAQTICGNQKTLLMTIALTSTRALPKQFRLGRRGHAMLPRLGNFLARNLTHALTGVRGAPAAFRRRALANGVQRAYLELAERQARNQAALGRVLLSIAENHLSRADYWHELGMQARTKEYYFDAAILSVSANLLVAEPKLKASVVEQYRRAYAAAAPFFANPAELIAMPCLSGVLQGYLRLPLPEALSEDQVPVQAQERSPARKDRGSEPSPLTGLPCVVLFNGLNSPKEELHYAENALLAAGLATISFDYLNTDAAGCGSPINAEEITQAVYLFISSRAELDPGRVGLLGLSMGGRAALYSAMRQPHQYKACAVISTPYDLVADLDLVTPAMTRELALPPGTPRSVLSDIAGATPLKGLLGDLLTPLLVAGGGRDLIAMPEEMRQIYDESGSTDKTLRICPHAGHNCYEMMPSLRHEIAQWLKQRL